MSTVTGGAGVAEKVLAMAEAARWAPSVHNSQPWRFEALPDGLAVHRDDSRDLPVLDPNGRMRTLSCGAAVLNAAVALGAAGFRPKVHVLPDAEQPSLMATVTAGPALPPGPEVLADAAAVPVRRTHRRVHSSEKVDGGALQALQRAVTREGARLTVADRTARGRLAVLLAEAVRAQAETPEFVQEVESWVRHWGVGADVVDGIPVGSLGTAPYPVDSLVQEQTDPTSVRDAELAAELADSTVVAISTAGDTVRDWLIAGMALERLLLRATTAGLVATFADQATQRPETRTRLREVLDVLDHPQIVLRLGHPLVNVPATPRRPLADLLR